MPRVVVSSEASTFCQQCGKLFYRRADEHAGAWAKRRLCSRACAQAMQAAQTTVPTGTSRVCEVCGSVFTKKSHQAGANWARLRCCSRACGYVLRSRLKLARLPDIATAFNSYIEKTDGCWLWRGTISRYGIFHYAKRRYDAHVFALKLDGRPVPKGKFGLHHCDNKTCVRPSHLYVGTPKNNSDDAVSRGLMPHGVRHPCARLTPEAVLEMRRMRKQGVTFAQIARPFNVTTETAIAAVLGWTWKRDVPLSAADLADLKQIRARRR